MRQRETYGQTDRQRHRERERQREKERGRERDIEKGGIIYQQDRQSKLGS